MRLVGVNMADSRHPIQKLLDDRAEAARVADEKARVAEEELVRVQARLDAAWIAVSTLMAEAAARANAVLEKNETLVSFKYVPPEAGGPRLEIHFDVDLDQSFGLSLDLDAIPEPRIIADGDSGIFAAPFSDLDALLTEMYDEFSKPR